MSPCTKKLGLHPMGSSPFTDPWMWKAGESHIQITAFSITSKENKPSIMAMFILCCLLCCIPVIVKNAVQILENGFSDGAKVVPLHSLVVFRCQKPRSGVGQLFFVDTQIANKNLDPQSGLGSPKWPKTTANWSLVNFHRSSTQNHEHVKPTHHVHIF